MRNRYAQPDDSFDDAWDDAPPAADDFDRDDPLEQDQDDDPHEELATDTCSACGREILADVAQCPYCGEFAPTGGDKRSRRPLWFVVSVVLLLMVILFVWTFR